MRFAMLNGKRRCLMKIGTKTVTIFKMKNRKGYAALCDSCLTEGSTSSMAYARMVKAITRIEKKKKTKKSSKKLMRI